MRFDLSIKNLGKISDANIKIRPFTVIAGKNSSGKSFVTKSLYSIFNTINKDHLSDKAYSNIYNLKFFSEVLTRTTQRPSKQELALFSELLSSIYALEEVIDQAFGAQTFSDQIIKTHQLKEPIELVEANLLKAHNEIAGKNKFVAIASYFDVLKEAIKSLKLLIESPTDTLADEIDKDLSSTLKQNFQVSNLSELKNFHYPDRKNIEFDLDSLGKVKITNEKLSFELVKSSIDEIQKLHNVVYLESPVYWKIANALQDIQTNKKIRKPRQQNITLTGVPKHFYDLKELIDTKTTAPSIELYQSLNTAIGGEITLSNTGALSYTEKDSKTEINLHNTALGITNLGIISLLLKKGILSKGSFLFIDEPEVHLHPSWQKTMVETLYALSKSGVNVVIASHSIDMMKCVENIMDGLPDAEVNEHFGINQLNSAGESVEESPYPLRQIAAIKADLGESFNDMVMEGNFNWGTE